MALRFRAVVTLLLVVTQIGVARPTVTVSGSHCKSVVDVVDTAFLVFDEAKTVAMHQAKHDVSGA